MYKSLRGCYLIIDVPFSSPDTLLAVEILEGKSLHSYIYIVAYRRGWFRAVLSIARKTWRLDVCV